LEDNDLGWFSRYVQPVYIAYIVYLVYNSYTKSVRFQGVNLTENDALKALKQIISSEPWLSSEGFHSFEFFEGDMERGKDNFGKKMAGQELQDNLASFREGWGIYGGGGGGISPIPAPRWKA
jgi:hypothetical protein